MKHILNTVFIGCPGPFKKEMAQGLNAWARILDHLDSLDQAHDFLANHSPDLVFLALSRDRDRAMALAARIRKKQPKALIFMVTRERDPELILTGFRHGAADFISPETTGSQAASRVREALSRVLGQSRQAEVFTLFSLKGGAGVTSLAINLADQIHRLARDKVLVLDLNLFMGDMASYLNFSPGFTPFDLIGEIKRMDRQLLFSSIFRHEAGIHILTTPEEIHDADSVTGQEVVEMMTVLKDHFDYIVVDAPHDFSDRTLKLFSMTDRLLVLAQQSLASAKSVQKVVDFLDDIDFNPDRLDIILNRHLRKSQFRPAELEHVFGRPAAHLIENDYALLLKAANKGKLLGELAPHARITRQMAKAASALTGIRPMKKKSLKTLLFKE